MRADLTQTLYNDFPDLYWQHTLDSSESSMCRGFGCGDGWYDIIYTLSSEIAAIVASYAEAHAALRNKTNSSKDDIAQTDEEPFDPRMYSAERVQEKWGTLIFDVSRPDDEMDEIGEAIAKAEAKAENTCERCGSEGIMRRDDGWYRVSCDSCEEARQAEWGGRQRRDSGVFLE